MLASSGCGGSRRSSAARTSGTGAASYPSPAARILLSFRTSSWWWPRWWPRRPALSHTWPWDRSAMTTFSSWSATWRRRSSTPSPWTM